MRMGRILHPQARAATPLPLLLIAAAVPATAVPCPYTSRVSELLSYTFQPGTILAASSGCVPSTPVSRMAMMTLLLPVVRSHAAGPLILGKCHSFE